MSDKLKNIPQQKLKAFSIGSMGKRGLSKRELEEQRKKEEERAAAHVFQEFVETFQESPSTASSKVWVKAGTYDAGARKEDTKDKGKLYKPTSRLSSSHESQTTAEQAQAYAKLLALDKKPDRLGKKRPNAKSNLESFKEELRQIQEEREERHKYKGQLRTPAESELDVFLKVGDVGSFDNGDPSTTNLYLGNLNPKLTEQQLMEIFGRYGPLASIKIMWPRSDEEKSRGRNCGFVAYMSRKDGERALRYLNGQDVFGYEMKLGWGKSVVIPPHPIYIPPTLLELSLPPPPSGLPFNAQPQARDKDVLPKSDEELYEILERSLVKVVIPTDRNLLMLIHRMVEFVIREGPMFEAMIMNRELHNPLFRFLFENQSAPHIYYRWKIYSIMHGDSQKEWSLREFRMFKEGSAWKPPVMNNYTAGMPDELVDDDAEKMTTKGSLSNTQRDRLEDLIRNLTPEAKKIGEVMVFCIEHSEAVEEVTDCIMESLSNESTLLTKKIARLYLISDILHNCAVKVTKASSYRKAFESRLIGVMKQMKGAHDKLEGRLKAEGFKMRVLRTLKAWEDNIYPKNYMDRLHNTFLGLAVVEHVTPEVRLVDNIDGDPLLDQNETDDDTPMDGAALLKSVLKQNITMHSPSPDADTDIDGKAIEDESDDNDDDDESNMNAGAKSTHLAGFIPSKWETVDPDQIEAQAMTTSKWDMLESSADASQDSGQNDASRGSSNDCSERGGHMSEERRTKLREIEVKAVQYQDELESGQRSLKTGWTVAQQVEHYRRKLLRKSERERKEKEYLLTTKSGGGAGTRDSGNTSSKHKRDYSSESDEGSASGYTTKKSKKHSRSSSTAGGGGSRRSRSRSPPPPPMSSSSSSAVVCGSNGGGSSGSSGGATSRRKSARAPSPPSPPKIRRHSPAVSSSRRYNKSPSPAASSGASRSGKSNRYSPYSSPRGSSSRHDRRGSPCSPPPPSSSSRRGGSPSSGYSRYSRASPESSGRKHRHKHKF